MIGSTAAISPISPAATSTSPAGRRTSSSAPAATSTPTRSRQPWATFRASARLRRRLRQPGPARGSERVICSPRRARPSLLFRATAQTGRRDGDSSCSMLLRTMLCSFRPIRSPRHQAESFAAHPPGNCSSGARSAPAAAAMAAGAALGLAGLGKQCAEGFARLANIFMKAGGGERLLMGLSSLSLVPLPHPSRRWHFTTARRAPPSGSWVSGYR